MNSRQSILAGLLVVCGVFGVMLAGCGPNYPNCNTDEDCRQSDKGQDEGRLHCVNGICQQCETSDHCPDGEKCSAGDCEPIEGYCEGDEACSEGEICENNRCTSGCRSDDDCPGEEVCKDNQCQEKQVECTMDADCGTGEKCENNECVEDDSRADCSLETVYFGYDTAELSTEARNNLESNAECIKQQERDVKIAGHADERGTNEYNIALGERRAGSARDYLKSLGVSSGRMETISYGEERLARRCGEDGPESCHEQNRRVEFNWK